MNWTEICHCSYSSVPLHCTDCTKHRCRAGHSALRKATPSNSPLRPSMHCAGNFILEFPSINSPILMLTHACTAKLVICSTDLAHMRHCENRRDREFMLGNSRMKLPDAMHAGQERWLRRGHGLAASAAPVVLSERTGSSVRFISAHFAKCTKGVQLSLFLLLSTRFSGK